MASVGGSLTWEAEDLEGELCLGAGVGAAGEDKQRQMELQTEKACCKHEWTEFLRELVDGVVEVTGVRFI